jgi:hypothetical protein
MQVDRLRRRKVTHFGVAAVAAWSLHARARQQQRRRIRSIGPLS